MEAMLAGKPRSVAIGALRALVVPLREHWGDLEGFREAGLDVLAKEGGGTLYDEKQSPAHLEQVYRQTVRARAMHFRPIENPAQLETLHKELDLVAERGGLVAFVEVKARAAGSWGHALHAITAAKRKDLAVAARGWIAAHGRPFHSFRFDAVVVVRGPSGTRVEHVEDAWRL